MSELSIVIPARNEQFLTRTIYDIFENAQADTEVIAVWDGWMPEHDDIYDRVRVIHFPEAIGQRAATNCGVSRSRARYVMKLDAHCALGQGFDRILIEDCQPNWTMIPHMYNLHAFDWCCQSCGDRTYQGAKPPSCEACGGTQLEQVEVWERRRRFRTVSWRFDREMRFRYWRRHKERQNGELIETMSCLGDCFFCTRDRFWEMEGLDEQHGSWGQFGTEIACKTWLSGGKLVTTLRTWHAHLFRTANFRGYGQSSWPYPITDADIEKARKYSRDLWLNDRWPKAQRPLSWLVEKFRPVPDWHDS